MQEILDIYNEDWQRIGTASRDEVHERGLLHRVVHCWIIQENQPVFWFQQRAHTKKDFPDCFDLPCGGHVDAGETPIQAMLRELREEIGLYVTRNDLISLGAYRAPDFHIPRLL
jgi:isopentenyldiphosphate isomerase